MRLPITTGDTINTSDFNEKVNDARRLKLAQELVGKGGSFMLIKNVADKLPEFIPGNVSYRKNMAEAANMSPVEFVLAIQSNGKWDYKRLNTFGLYEDFGNSNFAVVARAANIPDIIAKIGAGLYQIHSGTSPLEKHPPLKEVGVSWSAFVSDPDWGDDPKDQRIINGMQEVLDALEYKNLDSTPVSSLRMNEPDIDINYMSSLTLP